MKTLKLKTIIGVALFVALWTTQTASAWYDPSAGRWLTRDPIGEPGFQALGRAQPTPQPSRVASSPIRWINRDSANEVSHYFVQNQQRDSNGLYRKEEINLYAFVGNDPLQNIDPLGLRQRPHFRGPYACQLVKDEDYCPKWKLINHRCTYICVDNIQSPIEIFVEVRPTIFKCSKNILIWVPYATED